MATGKAFSTFIGSCSNENSGVCTPITTKPASLYFAALGNEVVVWIDDEKCGDLFLKPDIFHVLSSSAFAYIESQICWLRPSTNGITCPLRRGVSMLSAKATFKIRANRQSL